MNIIPVALCVGVGEGGCECVGQGPVTCLSDVEDV